MNTIQKNLVREQRQNHKELDKSKERISDRNIIMGKLYEDHVFAKLREDRFIKISPDHEKIKEKVEYINSVLEAAKEQALNTDNFLKLVKKYIEIKKLHAEIIRGFVDKVILFKTEKVDGRRYQRIRIYYNCIGAIDIPKIESKRA